MMSKLFIDDVRNAPDNSWDVVRNYKDAIAYLIKNEGYISLVSFDHDLGENSKTGYDIIVWLEKKVFTENYYGPLKMTVHSQNPVGVYKIKITISQIMEYRLRKLQ